MCDSPENRIDVGNIGDPRGMEGNRQPAQACNDSEEDKRIQFVRERQARDKPPSVLPALSREDHDCGLNGPQSESGAWHHAKAKEYSTYEDDNSCDRQCGSENAYVPGGGSHPRQASSHEQDNNGEDCAQN